MMFFFSGTYLHLPACWRFLPTGVLPVRDHSFSNSDVLEVMFCSFHSILFHSISLSLSLFSIFSSISILFSFYFSLILDWLLRAALLVQYIRYFTIL